MAADHDGYGWLSVGLVGSESWEKVHCFFITGTCGTQNCFPYDMKMKHTSLSHEKLANLSAAIQGIPPPIDLCVGYALHSSAAAAAKSLQSCQILCDSIDGSPPGSPVPGIL